MMGYNTVLMLCNDQLHDIEHTANVGHIISELVQGVGIPKEHRRYPHGYRGLKAISTQHADCEQIVRVTRNNGDLVGVNATFMEIIRLAVALTRAEDRGEHRKILIKLKRVAKIHASVFPDILKGDR